MRNIIPILILVAGTLTSCVDEYGKFEIADTGLQYRIVDNNRHTGKKPQVGDLLELKYSYEVEGGKVLFDSNNDGKNYLKKLEKPAHTGGSIEDGLAMMEEGDSAVFKITAENFLLFSEKFGHLPQDVSALDPIIIKVRLVDIMDKEDMELYMSSSYHNSEEHEQEILESFLANANITVEPTQSGLYYIENVKGSGDFIKDGDFITLNYTLTLADGALVETTLGNEPMKFTLGRDRMIAGWEEAMHKMQKGTSCQLIIPSKLAYGAEGKGSILPYSTLIFDIEILDVQ